jgi:hypothetical protein
VFVTRVLDAAWALKKALFRALFQIFFKCLLPSAAKRRSNSARIRW